MVDPLAKVKKAVAVKRAVSPDLASKAARASKAVSDSRTTEQKIKAGETVSVSRASRLKSDRGVNAKGERRKVDKSRQRARLRAKIEAEAKAKAEAEVKAKQEAIERKEREKATRVLKLKQIEKKLKESREKKIKQLKVKAALKKDTKIKKFLKTISPIVDKRKIDPAKPNIVQNIQAGAYETVEDIEKVLKLIEPLGNELKKVEGKKILETLGRKIKNIDPQAKKILETAGRKIKKTNVKETLTKVGKELKKERKRKELGIKKKLETAGRTLKNPKNALIEIQKRGLAKTRGVKPLLQKKGKKIGRVSVSLASNYKDWYEREVLSNPVKFATKAVISEFVAAGFVAPLKGLTVADDIVKSGVSQVDEIDDAIKTYKAAGINVRQRTPQAEELRTLQELKRIANSNLDEINKKINQFNKVKKPKKDIPPIVDDIKTIADKTKKKIKAKPKKKTQAQLNKELAEFEEARRKQVGQKSAFRISDKKKREILLKELEEVNKKLKKVLDPKVNIKKKDLDNLVNKRNKILDRFNKLDGSKKSIKKKIDVVDNKIKKVKKKLKEPKPKKVKIPETGRVINIPLERKKVSVFIKDTKKKGLSNKQIDDLINKPRGKAQLEARAKNIKEQISKGKVLEKQLEFIVKAPNIDKFEKVKAFNKLGALKNALKNLDNNLKQIGKRVKQTRKLEDLSRKEIIDQLFDNKGRVRLYNPSKSKKVKITSAKITNKGFSFETELGTIELVTKQGFGFRTSTIDDMVVRFKPKTGKFRVIKDRTENVMKRATGKAFNKRYAQGQKKLFNLKNKYKRLNARTRNPNFKKALKKLNSQIDDVARDISVAYRRALAKQLAKALAVATAQQRDIAQQFEQAMIKVQERGVPAPQIPAIPKLEKQLDIIKKKIDEGNGDDGGRPPGSPTKPPKPPKKPPKKGGRPPRPPKKPPIEEKLKISLPRLRFDSKRLDNKVLTFEGSFRERKFRGRPAGKANPIITKTIRIIDTRNRALKRVATRVDKSLARSLTLKVVGIGKAKKDIKTPNNLKKFTQKKSKNTPVLRLVEKAKNTFDTKSEVREARLQKARKKKKPAKKKTTKKKVVKKVKRKKR